MKENYDKAMRAIFQEIPKGTRLLLHSCCAPCSSACLETLRETFSVTVFYYNPNIDEDAEYEKRKAEQIRFLRETSWADFYDCDHDAAAFARAAKVWKGNPNGAGGVIAVTGSVSKKRPASPERWGFTGFVPRSL